jgi:hypothetical protein
LRGPRGGTEGRKGRSRRGYGGIGVGYDLVVRSGDLCAFGDYSRRSLQHVADVLVGPGDILSDRLLSRRAPDAKVLAHAARAHKEADHRNRDYFEGRKVFKSSHYQVLYFSAFLFTLHFSLFTVFGCGLWRRTLQVRQSSMEKFMSRINFFCESLGLEKTM